jgi:hypothetical protein
LLSDPDAAPEFHTPECAIHAKLSPASPFASMSWTEYKKTFFPISQGMGPRRLKGQKAEAWTLDEGVPDGLMKKAAEEAAKILSKSQVSPAGTQTCSESKNDDCTVLVPMRFSSPEEAEYFRDELDGRPFYVISRESKIPGYGNREIEMSITGLLGRT